ncbi:MAG: ATP phosphoribosyltransferase regulatory subunit [Deltaproteobacteria bacterium]|nr:ATP phosphoribosyltransferase regulatory subunit [Deltaproteobacteria bacterium]
MVSQLNISLPQGVRDILPEEAEKARHVEDAVISVFEKNGFKQVITPLLEYLDVVLLGLGAELKDKIFKFVESVSGKIIAIRPDITPQVARMVAARMKDYPLPLKLCYNENIVRYDDLRAGTPVELRQIGAEYIGEDSSKADAEIISTAIEAMKKTKVMGFKIDIGHIGFFKGLMEDIKANKSIEKSIRRSVLIKDSSSLKEILSSVKDSDSKRIIAELPFMFGGKEVIGRVKPLVKAESARKALDDIAKVIEILKKRKMEQYVTVDLGEVRGFDYYTGIIFEGFAKGVGKALLRGGRYDNLLGKYGYPCPATGFAINIESVAAAIKKENGV